MLFLFHILPQYVVQSGGKAVNSSVWGINTSVLGMVAKGMDACDNVSCSTTLHGSTNWRKRCKYQWMQYE